MEFYYDEVDGDILIIKADGGLNADTADQFGESIEKLVDAGLTQIIIDCTRLEYISSIGLSVLIRLHRRMRRHGGDVKIASIKGLVADVLSITRLDTVFDIYPDVNRARLAFRPRTASR